MERGMNSNPWESVVVDQQTRMINSRRVNSLGEFALRELSNYTHRSYKRANVASWNRKLRNAQATLQLDDAQMKDLIKQILMKDPLNIQPEGYSSLSRLLNAIYATRYNKKTELKEISIVEDDDYSAAYK